MFDRAEDAEVRRLLDVVLPAVASAGEIARRHFRAEVAVTDKSGGAGRYDPVTVADRDVEAHLRAALTAAFPDDGIVGEEHGTTAGGEHTWVIDPIDGTGAYVTGSPLWGILVGRRTGARCDLGLLHQPILGETFLGDGAQAWLAVDGRPARRLATSGVTSLADAALGCTTPGMFTTSGERAAFADLVARVRLSRFGGDCYAYAQLAMGGLDLCVEASLQPYDILPLVPLVEGAGGVVTDLDGEVPLSGGFVIAAATPDLHAEALGVARRAHGLA